MKNEGGTVLILIADDHEVVRRGLAELLEEFVPGATVVQAADFAACRRWLSQEPIDLLVLDMIMPDGNGLEFLKQVHHHYPKLPVVVLSVHAEQDYALRALRAGAMAYLAKDSTAQELEQAVLAALRGQRYLKQTTADRLVGHLRGAPEEEPHQRLSDREFEVMELLAGGKTLGTIGDMLGLSPKTVSTYRGRVMEKLGLENDSEFFRYCITHNLIH